MRCEYKKLNRGCTSIYCELPRYKSGNMDIPSHIQREFCLRNPHNCPYHPVNNTGFANRMSRDQKNQTLKNAFNNDKKANSGTSVFEYIAAIIFFIILLKIFKWMML